MLALGNTLQKTLLNGARKLPINGCTVRNIQMPIKYPYPPLYIGIYKTDGEKVRKGDLILVQKKWDYFPGLNITPKIATIKSQTKLKLLMADCDGTVLISRELCNLNVDHPEVEEKYIERVKDGIEIRKLHFNVVPDEKIGKFNLQCTR